MNLHDVFDLMIKENASDAILKAGSPIRLRIFTELKEQGKAVFSGKEIEAAIAGLVTPAEKKLVEQRRGYEGAVSHGEAWRFRIGIFWQQGQPAIVARKIDLQTLNFEKLNLPAAVLESLCRERRGLILLVGMAGSGKSTTIASMIEHINQNAGRHILTAEEPIEYVFREKMSVINQREIGRDVADYEEALKQMANLSPDILYIGDIRDAGTCSAVLKAAEKGILVFSTLHSVNAQTTVETLINFFPREQQDRMFVRLSLLLKGVIAQRLIPRDGAPGLIPAYEVMTLSPTIAAAIAEKRIVDIPKIIRESSDMFGMNTYEQCLLRLIRENKIAHESALEYSDSRKDIEVSLTYRRE
ncbi:MAG: PilT/PilU family type 4a pilus ATPase [Pseudomonadota bacterium]